VNVEEKAILRKLPRQMQQLERERKEGGRVCAHREKRKGVAASLKKEKAQQFSIKFVSTQMPAFKIFPALTASILFRD